MSERSAKLWFLKAENDWKTAKDEFATERPATDTVCFHCQQCAEKYLKGFLVFHGREVPRTHNIGELIYQCLQIDERFEELLRSDVVMLTPYATETRYPGEESFPSVEATERALEAAEKVKQFVLALLEERGFWL